MGVMALFYLQKMFSFWYFLKKRLICPFFSTSFFAKYLHVVEDGPGRGHLCHTDTFLVFFTGTPFWNNCSAQLQRWKRRLKRSAMKELTVFCFAVFQLSNAIRVNCNEYGWDIAIDIDMLRKAYPDIKSSNIYLGKNLCGGTEDGSRLVFKQGLRDCLTSETVGNIMSIQYYNYFNSTVQWKVIWNK